MRICISMPAYNEADGISIFLDELISAFLEYDLEILIVNDKSTDDTSKVLHGYVLSNSSTKIKIIDSEYNLGHGPATLMGLNSALKKNYDYLIAIDGDGQFIATEIVNALKITITEKYDVVEGVRTKRTDPRFRKISTFATQILIYLALRSFPKDANTPLRIYEFNFLKRMLSETPIKLMTPNLFFSGATRIISKNYLELPVTSVSRRGTSAKGSSWNQKFDIFPSRRFLKFCFRALIEYQTIIKPNLKNLRMKYQKSVS